MSAPWSTVSQTALGRALQALGSRLRHRLNLLRAVYAVAAGAAIASLAGWALLQSDTALPDLVRQFCLIGARRYGAAGYCPLLPSDTAILRYIALGFLLAGQVLAAGGVMLVRRWRSDRKKSCTSV